MSRLALVIALLGLLAAAPAGSGALPADRVPAAVRLVDCVPAAGTAPGSASFRGRMRSIAGTRQMRMRFTLLERIGSGEFRPVRAPGLGAWRRARGEVSRFVYKQAVEGLKPDAAYRMAVEYRWLGTGGAILRSARRRSSVCAQPGTLPNLRVLSVRARPGPDPGTSLYSVVVRNSGGTSARDVEVGLTVDGVAAAPSRSATLLRPLQSRRVELTAPVCSRGLTAVVDPANLVREAAEDDNLRTLPCA